MAARKAGSRYSGGRPAKKHSQAHKATQAKVLAKQGNAKPGFQT